MDPDDRNKVLRCVHGLVHEIVERLEDLESRTSSIEEMLSPPLVVEKRSSPGDE